MIVLLAWGFALASLVATLAGAPELSIAFMMPCWALVIAGAFGWRGPSLRKIHRENGVLYLRRWALREQKRSGDNAWRIYLHQFLTGDGDGHHNHPWRWSLSIVLWGSYTEEYFDLPEGAGEPRSIHTRRVRWFNLIPARRYHRIIELHPGSGRVWTLFFSGPVVQKWGFWVTGRGHVHWATRIAERGLAEGKTQ